MSRWDDSTPAFALDHGARLFRETFRREPLGIAAWLPKSRQWVVQDVVAVGVDYVQWVTPRDRGSGKRLVPAWLDRLAALLHSRLPQSIVTDYWENVSVQTRILYANSAMSLACRRMPDGRRTHPRICGALPQTWVIPPDRLIAVTPVTDVTVDVLRSAALAVVPPRWRP